MVYDVMSFYKEFMLLDLRLDILDEVVDKFIIVEADKTYKVQDKPLYFKDNVDRYSRYKDKIIHVSINNYPANYNEPWVIENYQRNYAAKILSEICSDEDIIILSDLDEIVSPDVVKNFSEDEIYSLEMFNYYYFYNNINLMKPLWNSAKIFKYKNMCREISKYDFWYQGGLVESVNEGTTLSKIRMLKTTPTIPCAGWHFTYMGGVNAIYEKIHAFAHETGEWRTKEYIEKQLKMGNGILGGKEKYLPLKLSSDHKLFPEKLIDMQEIYKDYIVDNAEGKFPYIYILRARGIRMIKEISWRILCHFPALRQRIRNKMRKMS